MLVQRHEDNQRQQSDRSGVRDHPPSVVSAFRRTLRSTSPRGAGNQRRRCYPHNVQRVDAALIVHAVMVLEKLPQHAVIAGQQAARQE